MRLTAAEMRLPAVTRKYVKVKRFRVTAIARCSGGVEQEGGEEIDA
jgi:hypothetical protein